jgi:hypothetical protein
MRSGVLHVLASLLIGKLPPDQIVPALPKSVWFSRVGEAFDERLREACAAYLRHLDLASLQIAAARDWPHALQLASVPDESGEWWQRERAEERRLFETAAAMQSADAALLRLTNLMHGSAELFHPPAMYACTRAGITDPEPARAAAGAAAHCLHQYGVAALAGEGDTHLFAAKFRIFLAGRWPLGVWRGAFVVF